MLAKFSFTQSADRKIIFGKEINEENASPFGAFSSKSKLCLYLLIPRTLGITYPILRLTKDGEESNEIPMEFEGIFDGSDRFGITLDLKKLCGNEHSGLFYYDFIFPLGEKRLFSSTFDNLNLELSECEGSKFRLLVYEDGFDTPKWFKGGIMYHIFVDRFARGSFSAPVREDAEMNEDWENGIPQYGEYPGAFVKNNVFFGGNLVGIREKLPYLKSLGVTVIYLSPIFKAYSNHKYDTGDYMQVDEMFGGEKALLDLINQSEKCGIKIILDGVFNHTGDDSKYFNKYGKYESVGAYQSKDSEFYDWYHWKDHPDQYESWWGITILPKLNPRNESCRNYFVEGEDSVVGKYTKMGIGGIRLDVADELTDDFLEGLRKTTKKFSKGESVIIGEVWENAADKIAYGKRRKYFRGAQLDSVMNYPFRSAAVDYLLSGDSSLIASELTELYASYPKCVSDSLMNILGTHDTERILTVLGGEDNFDKTNDELARIRMDEETKEKAVKLLKLGSVLQYTVYGVPSVFYGDEAGLEGYRDPFCRMPFPWGRENAELLSHYTLLGKIRNENKLFRDGLFKIRRAEGGYIEYERVKGKSKAIIAINRGEKAFTAGLSGKDLLTGKTYSPNDSIPPLSAVILKI